MIKHVNKFTNMNWFTVLVVFCLAVVQPCLTTSCEETASTTGTHFMFGVPNKKSYAGNSSGLIHFTPQSSTGARVTITIPFINFHHQFAVYDTLTVPLPYSLRQTEFGLKSKGVEIVSDSIISVTVELNYESTNSEGFLVLPTSALSTRYIAASYHPWIGIFPNSILIVGIENDTFAQINYTENGEQVVKSTGRLQKFDTYQLFVYFEDVSGAVITSNKPVAVIASSYYSQIPVNCSFNFIVEQMVPTKFWTNNYIVPPIYNHTLNIVRVFADHEDTVVNYFNHTHHVTDNLSRGEMKEILFGADPVVIIAEKPIGVIQYAAPECRDTFSWWYRVDQPVMMTSQGMSQYTDTYYFFNPQPSRQYYYTNEPNYLVITIQRNETSGLDLNGNSLSYWNVTTVPVSSPLADYVTLYVYNISHNSSFQLHHRHGVKFGAFIYGFSYDVSFGYPLQLALSSNECQSQPDFSFFTTDTPAPVTSSGHTTQRPGPGQHTIVSTQHLLQQTTVLGLMSSSTSFSQTVTGNSTWCFACNGIMHLKYCDIVKPCNTETEVCHVTRYAKSSSVQVYSTGCMEKDMCTVAGPSVDCQTCCAGSFCNTVGCGDTGLPDRSYRGPMCFACDHLGENDQCQTVQMCAPGQVCKIEKYVWGKEFNYVMGCSDQRLCLSKRYLTSPEKRHSPNMTPLEKGSIKVKTPEERSTPVCLRCCNDDFCNMNCTSIHQAQFIATTGTHFMFGVPYKNPDSGSGNSSGVIHLTSKSFTGAKVTMTIPFIHFNHQFTVYDTLTIPLPVSLMQTEFGRKWKGVEIVSDKNISVTVDLGYTEGFLVLSTSALSTKYIAASYLPWIVYHNVYQNSILIVGIENDTYAQINYTENGERVVKATGRLQKFDTYQLLVYFDDVSSAVITSNKPVAVIASSYYSQIPVNCSYNFIVEQMVPTKFWTNNYIVSPIYKRAFNIVRVFADHENTVLNYCNHTHHVTDNLSRGEMKEILFGADPVIIIADKPIGVMQYAASSCNDTREWWSSVDKPLMITSMSQFSDTYYFYNPERYSYYPTTDNFLVLTIHQNYTTGLVLNGKSLPPQDIITLPVSPPFADYVTLFVNISHNSSFKLEHMQGVKFGAFIYGRSSA